MDPVSHQTLSFEYFVDEKPAQRKLTPQIFFLFLGLMNNLPFSLILGFIQNESTSFAQLNLIYLIIALVSIIAMVANILWLIETEQKLKILGVVIGNVVALLFYLIIRIINENNQTLGFVMDTVAVVAAGVFRFVGETMILSYMGKRNPEWVMGWSAGTGLVSLLGTGLYYLAVTSKVSEWIILAVLIWLQIIVGVLFAYVDRDNLFQIDPMQMVSKPSELREKPQSMFGKILSRSDKYLFHVILICFFSYALLLIFCSNHQNTPTLPATIMYEIGTCLSRSSLFFIKMEKWHYVTLVQAVNFVVWFILYFFVPIPQWVELLWILLVGVVAGTVYVNLFYEVLQRRDLNTKMEEISINLIMIGLLLGVLGSIGLQILLWNVESPVNS